MLLNIINNEENQYYTWYELAQKLDEPPYGMLPHTTSIYLFAMYTNSFFTVDNNEQLLNVLKYKWGKQEQRSLQTIQILPIKFTGGRWDKVKELSIKVQYPRVISDIQNQNDMDETSSNG